MTGIQPFKPLLMISATAITNIFLVISRLVINIPGQNVSSGTVLSDYIGSGPPKGTGLHRYVFLVYKQPENITDTEHGHLTTSGENRANFKVVEFAKKHHLGNPVAGNFFQ
ncbi:unnamed protein product, partial [Onchocerca ochengi]|uniref:Phosphatidylethanolamine-binding protein n=1 Tax=Onchocerca ochengi TaxID=42157 RepID=A0A182EWD8_ONCOC